jgi:hypothetical protein
MARVRPQPSPVTLGLLIAIAVVVVQALLVPLFSAPAANIAPRHLPIVVAGPAPTANAFAAQLVRARPGAFDVTVAPDAAAADQAIKDRSAYGAIVIGAAGPSLHTASAASPTVAALLTQAATTLSGGQPVHVVDVVPLDADDPRGAGFGAGFLPLVMTGMLAGILLFLLVPRRGARLAGLLAFAVLAGLAGTAVLQYGLGILPGSYLANASAVALLMLAVGATIVGLGALLGAPGVGLGALITFLIGNALAGIGAAPELLPEPWGAVGQYLPVGAGGTLLRSTAYFDGAGGARAAWVLAAYALIGLVVVGLGRGGRQDPAATAADPGTARTREPVVG